MTKEAEIIQALQTAASLTPSLTVTQYQRWSQNRDAPTFLDILKVYGTWTSALKASGLLEPRRYESHDFIQALRLASIQGGKLTSSQYQQWAAGRNVPSLGDIITHFGSWSLAVKAVEHLEEEHFTVQPAKEKAEMVQALYEAYRVLTPFNAITYQKWAKQFHKPSVAKVSRRFGSWKRALYELGIQEVTDRKR
ncbi:MULTISPECIES: hypothetical protein [Exiguobacterium]|uniref:Uncharacterized protein n=1 Tax=Exiguobacterium marinum TaxID=273528 RepID=A0ABY7WYM4_9BACL|nr:MULTISPECIES: hypothetical protein [Exiguobacterium]WDH75598.1 hypothetical protein PTI97_12295 [Exiguobacterium marinum]